MVHSPPWPASPSRASTTCRSGRCGWSGSAAAGCASCAPRDGVFALDHACPHEGYGLTQGDARRRPADVRVAQLEVPRRRRRVRARRGGRAHPPGRPSTATSAARSTSTSPTRRALRPRLLASLRRGIEHDYVGQVARDVVRLLRADANPGELVWEAVAYGAPRAEFGWGHSIASATDCLAHGRPLRRRPARPADRPGHRRHRRGRAATGRSTRCPSPARDAAGRPGGRRSAGSSRPSGLDDGAGAAARRDPTPALRPTSCGRGSRASSATTCLSYGHGAIYTQKAFQLLDRARAGSGPTPCCRTSCRRSSTAPARTRCRTCAPFMRALAARRPRRAGRRVDADPAWRDDGRLRAALARRPRPGGAAARRRRARCATAPASTACSTSSSTPSPSGCCATTPPASSTSTTTSAGSTSPTGSPTRRGPLGVAGRARSRHGAARAVDRLPRPTTRAGPSGPVARARHARARRPRRRRPRRPPSRTATTDAVGRAGPRAAGGRSGAQLERAALADRAGSFIVAAHLVKTTHAAVSEAAATGSKLPLAATARFMAAPRLERFVTGNVIRAIDFLSGRGPADRDERDPRNTEGGVEVARPEAFEVEGDVAVAGAPARRRPPRRAARRHAVEVVERRPRGGRCRRSGGRGAARKPRRAQARPRPARPAPSTPTVTGVPYGTRDARQAAAGLSHVRRPSARDARADVGLGEAGVDEREHGAPLGRRLLAGAVVAEVVDVDAEHDRGALGLGERREHVHQRGLAVEAAVAVVGHVGGVGQLVGLDRASSAGPTPRASARAVVLLARAASDGDTAVTASARSGAERVVGDPGEERRVGAAAERDDDRGRARAAGARSRVERQASTTSSRMRLLPLPFDSVFTTRMRPTSSVVRTWVPPSACLSRPTMSTTRISVHRLGDQVDLGADEVLVVDARSSRGRNDDLDRPVGGELGVDQLLDARRRSPRAAGRTRSPCGPPAAPCSRRSPALPHSFQITPHSTCSAVWVRISAWRRSQSTRRARRRRPPAAASPLERVPHVRRPPCARRPTGAPGRACRCRGAGRRRSGRRRCGRARPGRPRRRPPTTVGVERRAGRRRAGTAARSAISGRRTRARTSGRRAAKWFGSTSGSVTARRFVQSRRQLARTAARARAGRSWRRCRSGCRTRTRCGCSATGSRRSVNGSSNTSSSRLADG